jgi:NAD(P)-dependent dehydrogenase (short-subunit alcohol dehydrogenase family)
VSALAGRTAFVTGAGGGIGSAAALALAAAGASVVAVGRTAATLLRTVEAVEAAGGRAIAVEADVTSVDDVERALDAADSIDILVTCAGVQLRKPALEIGVEEWNEVISVNLTGVFLCCQRAARRMQVSGSGAIVNVTSLTERIGLANLAAYASSKGGVAQLTRTLAVELAPYGVRVNAVAPGRVATPMTADVFASDEARTSFLSRIPLGRPGLPEEVASAIVFLASSDSSYVTGETVVVDGGWLASGGNPLA